MEDSNETFHEFDEITTDGHSYRFTALDPDIGTLRGTLREIGQVLLEHHSQRAKTLGPPPWTEFDSEKGTWYEVEEYPIADWILWSAALESRAVAHTVLNLFQTSRSGGQAQASGIRYVTVGDGDGVELEYAVEDSGRVLAIRLYGPRSADTSGKDWLVLGFTSNQDAVIHRRPIEIEDLDYTVDDLFDGLDPLGSVLIGSYPVMRLGTDVYTLTVPVRSVTPTPR